METENNDNDNGEHAEAITEIKTILLRKDKKNKKEDLKEAVFKLYPYLRNENGNNNGITTKFLIELLNGESLTAKQKQDKVNLFCIHNGIKTETITREYKTIGIKRKTAIIDDYHRTNTKRNFNAFLNEYSDIAIKSRCEEIGTPINTTETEFLKLLVFD